MNILIAIRLIVIGFNMLLRITYFLIIIHTGLKLVNETIKIFNDNREDDTRECHKQNLISM
jgi:hypothetical protein